MTQDKPQDKPRCSARVLYSGTFLSFQCSRNGKVNVDGRWYCGQHDPAAVKARQDKRDREFREEQKRREAHHKREEQLRRRMQAALACIPDDWSTVQILQRASQVRRLLEEKYPITAASKALRQADDQA